MFSVCATIFDVKRGFVPEALCCILVFFGLASNLILSLISNNIKFILASIISMVLTYTITYLLWELHLWGGGDVMLLTGIATVIPFGLTIDFLNIFPMPSIYPFSFSVVINSILVSFPFLLIFVGYMVIKKDIFKSNLDMLMNVLSISNLHYIINQTLNKRIPVKDLREGNIVNSYYFNDEHIVELINDVDENLKVYKNNEDDGFKYYFKSLSAGGITKKDMNLLKIMSVQKIISDEISIKISYPFTPAIIAGLLIAVFYGDIMLLFAKNLVLVI
ncbi:A24 family peptidase [Methanobrevibacter sp.]|uniref:prepilin peptidase n=1 Tax=Methanobrevibacter sp. TaxID=66852 RepID=UPI0025FE2421|nr:A24 family peptidase [Methanobrevibacter sp.]